MSYHDQYNILCLVIILFVIIILFDNFEAAFCSITIERKHILDRTGDMVDYNFGANVTDKAKGYTDIKEIIYSVDRNLLNATIWFSDFKVNPRSEGNVTYGAYIDYDSNKATGWKGIDYELQLRWQNKRAGLRPALA